MGNCLRRPEAHYIGPTTTIRPLDLRTDPQPIATSIVSNAAPRNEMGPTNDICFQHLLESIYNASLKAMSNVQMNHLHQFFWYFPQDADGVHYPRTIPLKIPHGDGETRIVDVPFFTLVQHSHLAIHEIKLKTKLDMEMTVMPDVTEVHESLPQKTYYRIDLVPGDKSTDLEILIKLNDPPEVMNRLLHKFETRI